MDRTVQGICSATSLEGGMLRSANSSPTSQVLLKLFNQDSPCLHREAAVNGFV